VSYFLYRFCGDQLCVFVYSTPKGLEYLDLDIIELEVAKEVDLVVDKDKEVVMEEVMTCRD